MIKRQFLVFTVIGFGLLFAGVYFFIDYWYYGKSTFPSREITGIIISYYPYHDWEIGNVHFVMRLNPQSGIIDLELYFTYYKRGNYSFLMSLPYRITLISPLSSPPDPGEWSYKNAESGTVVSVIYQAEDDPPTGAYSPKLSSALQVKDSLTQFNLGYYSVSLPFGGSLSTDVQEQWIYLSEQVPLISEGAPGLIYLLIPSTAVITGGTHEISRRDPAGAFQLLEFQVEKFTPLFIQYMMPEQVIRFQNDLVLTGIFIGSGISTLIQITFESLRGAERPSPSVPKEMEKERIPKTQTKEAKNGSIKKLIFNIYYLSGIILILVMGIEFVATLTPIPNPFPQIDLYFWKNIIEFIAFYMALGDWGLLAYFVFINKRLKEIFRELEPAKRLKSRFYLALCTAGVSFLGVIFHETLVIMWMIISIQFFACIFAIDDYLRHTSN